MSMQHGNSQLSGKLQRSLRMFVLALLDGSRLRWRNISSRSLIRSMRLSVNMLHQLKDRACFALIILMFTSS
jgi:hypothetical protein